MQLGERKSRILQAVIDAYIETAEPVGSRTIAKRVITEFSPATIRNEMADLEEMGFLEKPHTSAGRIPSWRGYRYYVDTLMKRQTLATQEIENLRDAMAMQVREINAIIARAGSVLSGMTNYTAFAMLPGQTGLYVQNIRLLLLEEGKLLSVIVLSDGTAKNRILNCPSDVDERVAEALGKVLDVRLKGKKAEEINMLSITELAGLVRTHYEMLIHLEAFFKESLLSGAQVYVDGVSHIFNHPEFKDFDRAREFVNFVERSENLRELTSGREDAGEVTVSIGKENSADEMQDCSMVLSEFHAGGKTGTIGVIGPTRMDYAKIISMLEFITQGINEMMDNK